MIHPFAAPSSPSLLQDNRTCRKLELNYRKNRELDQTRNIDEAAAAFVYSDCREDYWTPEAFSLLHGTALWDEASKAQRILLNQLYWVAYFAQIVSAEIATILLNQAAAAGLSTIEDFRLVCDTLDFESSQERAHIEAFRSIGEAVEADVFGERIFTYPLRSAFAETMLYSANNRWQRSWRSVQMRAFTQLSSSNAFLGCQYLTVRGLRTLNGKLVQHALSRVSQDAVDPGRVPIPARISHFHFLDESFHFNSSLMISHDVVRCLPEPTRLERWIANRAIAGTQKDHYPCSIIIKGIFWHDPAAFHTVYRILRSKAFGFDHDGAHEMLRRCFTQENAALHESHRIHATAVDSYKAYLEPLGYVDQHNRGMRLMSRNSLEKTLWRNRRAYQRFAHR